MAQKMMKKGFIVVVLLMVAANAFAGGREFVDNVFESTGTVVAEKEAQRQGLPVGEGIRAGINTSRFKLIWLQIHIVCTEMGDAKPVGPWVKIWDLLYGVVRAAPFKAGGDWVLIMHLPAFNLLYTKTVSSGDAPEEDWTMPEPPKTGET